MPLACHQLVLKTCRTRDHNQEEQRQLLTSLLKRKLRELLICSEGTGEKSTTDQGQRFHHTCGTCSRERWHRSILQHTGLSPELPKALTQKGARDQKASGYSSN